jgi:hypothetical protein
MDICRENATYLEMKLDRSDRLEPADEIFRPRGELVIFKPSPQDVTPCGDHPSDIGNKCCFVRELGPQLSPQHIPLGVAGDFETDNAL